MYFTDKIFYVGHNMNMHMLNQFLKLPSMAWQCFYQLMLLCFLLLQLMEMQALSHGNRLHRDWKTLNVTTATVRGLSVLVISQSLHVDGRVPLLDQLIPVVAESVSLMKFNLIFNHHSYSLKVNSACEGCV